MLVFLFLSHQFAHAMTLPGGGSFLQASARGDIQGKGSKFIAGGFKVSAPICGTSK